MQLCHLVSQRKAIMLWLCLAYTRNGFLDKHTGMYHAMTNVQAMRWPKPQLLICSHNEMGKGAEMNKGLTCLNISVQGLVKLPDGL